MSSLKYTKWIVGCLLLALGGCRAGAPPAGGGSDHGSGGAVNAAGMVGEDPACTLESWRATLAIGLEKVTYGSDVEQRLWTVSKENPCPEIRQLAEVLLSDRGAYVPASLGTPAGVRVAGPDMARKPPNATTLRRKIVLQLTVDADGRVTEVEQVEGFHNDWIDQLIQETAPTWLFRPARDAEGYAGRTFDYSFFVGRP